MFRCEKILNNLRILIEPDWQRYRRHGPLAVPGHLPAVIAEPHGLLQAFLNLAQNSHRAVQEGDVRELDISVSMKRTTWWCVSGFRTGHSQHPERLFQPFQKGAFGTGMGLYVLAVIVRSYGGDLRFEPQPAGSCFARRIAGGLTRLCVEQSCADDIDSAGGRSRHVPGGPGAVARERART